MVALRAIALARLWTIVKSSTATGRGPGNQLVTSPVGYQLDAPDDSVDAWRLDQLLLQASAALAKWRSFAKVTR